MHFVKEYIRTKFPLILSLNISLLLTGCSTSDFVNSFGDMLGLNMHTSTEEPAQTQVEIEYIDSSADVSKEAPIDNVSSDEATSVSFSDNSEDDSASIDNPYYHDHEQKIYSMPNANEGLVTISFAGDVLLSEGCSVLNHVMRNNNDMTTSFDERLLSRMVDSDIFMLNNEFPYSQGGSPLPGKDYTFRADPVYAECLKGIGTDIVSLANNHAFDFGPDALDDTFKTLREIDMPYVGAGENIHEAVKPAYFHVEDKVICIIAATQIEGSMSIPHTRPATETENGVFRCVDTTQIKEVTEEAKSKSDFVIIFIHWGTEKTDVVREWQMQTARDLEGSGADLIIGAHSHCLQGIDYINDTPVFYSLGNYLFNSNKQDTCLVTLTLDISEQMPSIASLQFVPCIQNGGMTVEADEADKSRIIRYEQGISYHALLDENGYVTPTDKNMNIQNGVNTSPMRPKEEE